MKDADTYFTANDTVNEENMEGDDDDMGNDNTEDTNMDTNEKDFKPNIKDYMQEEEAGENLLMDINEGGDVTMTEAQATEDQEEPQDNGNEEEEAEEADDDVKNEDMLQLEGLGLDANGQRMPGFEEVEDSYLSFRSDCDFAIFCRQIVSDIPLQR
ncbi:hypothetical protein RFI_13327, partial [Reticulomyxa filosa]